MFARSNFSEAEVCKIVMDVIPPLPEPICSLLLNDDQMSKAFRNNIRHYNCAFAFTSIGADCKPAAGTCWQPPFTLHGQVVHRCVAYGCALCV